MGESTIRVILACDQCLLGQRVRNALSGAPDTVLIAELGNCDNVLNFVAQFQPDILILDDQMLDGKFRDLVRQLRISGSPVGILLLATCEDSSRIGPALDAGANGYVLKSSGEGEIIEAVEAVQEANNILKWVRFNSGSAPSH